MAVAAAAVVHRNKRPAAAHDGEHCPAEAAGEKKRSRFYYETVKQADYGSRSNSIDHDDYETVEEDYEFDSIDDYEILEDFDGPSSCGGGVGVARARDRCTGETVAVKRVRAAATDGGAASLCAAVHEAACLAACQGHPSVLQLKSVATDENTGDMFLVTEPPPAGTRTLRSHLLATRRGFSEAETRALMRQLLAAAAAMHGAGVTHRDLNPDNIILVVGNGPDVSSSTLKICGFGCATTAAATTKPAAAIIRHVVGGEPEPPMGAMRYRSPEQLYGGIPRYGPEEDMWALGCVMAELLAGGAPLFSADTEEGLLEQTIDLRDDIVTMEMEAFDDIAPELSLAGRELLAGLLEFDSWERPAAADALKQRWFAEEQVVKAESLALSQKKKKRKEKKRKNRVSRSSTHES